MSSYSATAPALAPADVGGGASDALLARLNEPDTVAALNDLLDGIETLSGLLTATGSFLARGEEVMDNVASSYREVAGMVSTDASLADTLHTAMKLAGQAAPLAATVADSAVLEKLADPALLDLLVSAASAVTKTRAAILADPAAHELGLTKAARATKDPDVRRGIGFVLGVLKELGRSLDRPANESPSESRVRTHQ